VQRPTRRRTRVGEGNGVGGGEVGRDLVVVHVAVDDGDAIAMATARDRVERPGPTLPGLADDGEPEAAGRVVVEPVERLDEMLETLVGPDGAEEQDVELVEVLIARRSDRICDVMVERAVRRHADRRLAEPVVRPDLVTVELRVHDDGGASAYEGGAQQLRIATGERELALAGVLGLVELDDDRCSEALRDRGEQEVRVHHRAGPPLEDDDVGAVAAQECDRPDHRRQPEPVDAIEDVDARRVVDVVDPCADPPASGVEPLRNQPAHEDHRHVVVAFVERVGDPAGVVADAARERPTGPDHAHPPARGHRVSSRRVAAAMNQMSMATKTA
jgi:hypothetical protein